MTTLETQVKQQVKEYLDIKHIFWFYNLQGLGAFKGIPDMCMFFRGKALFLEIKTPKGKLSYHQKIFQEQCFLNSIEYYVITSLEDLMAIVG